MRIKQTLEERLFKSPVTSLIGVGLILTSAFIYSLSHEPVFPSLLASVGAVLLGVKDKIVS